MVLIAGDHSSVYLTGSFVVKGFMIRMPSRWHYSWANQEKSILVALTVVGRRIKLLAKNIDISHAADQ
jgi:hypothetical protein